MNENQNQNTIVPGLTAIEKTKQNIWDHFGPVLKVLKKASQGKWTWTQNTQCKYIDLRIDMRTGHCILKNRNGDRINIEDFEKQVCNENGLPWKLSEDNN